MKKLLCCIAVLFIVISAAQTKSGKTGPIKQNAWGKTWDNTAGPLPTRKGGTVIQADPYFWNFESDSAFERIPALLNTWQWGIPTSGPGSAHSGQNCWATNLSGNYDNNADWKLTMPSQNLSGATNPQLQFYHWYSTETSYDSGWVDVSTNSGSTWTKISAGYKGSSGDWLLATVSLSAYAGMTGILIRFHFTSDASGTYPGWYIDDVSVVNLTLSSHPYQNSFEGTNGDLSEDIINPGVSAPWQRGVPTSGPNAAYDGSECWATNLAGDYNINADAAIVNGSNMNLLSAAYAEINFYQWFYTEAGYDSGWVEVSTSGANGPWTKASPSYRGTSSGWIRTNVDISSSTNTNRFRFRFRFKSDGSVVYAGWYIDSVRVSLGTVTVINSYDFEADNGGFTADPPTGDANEWHCGSPTSGPNAAYSGSNCWATDLAGDYENNAGWELRTPMVDLSGFAAASLQAASWYSTETGADLCIIEVSSDGGSSWNALRTYSGTSAGWTVDTLDVTPFISSTFKARFRFTSNSSVVYPGWYLDDVRIDTVGGYIAQDPIKIATNWIALYVSNDATTDAGTYTAATESGHTYGADITLLYGGESHNPWSSYNTVRSYRTNTDYVTRSSGATTEPGFTVSPLTSYYRGAKFLDARTLQQDWLITNGQDNFELRQRFGTQFWNDSSGLMISLVLVNRASQDRIFSFRYEWDTHVGSLDSPFLRRYYSLTPNAWEPIETNWAGLSSLWYTEESNDELSTQRHFTSVTAPTFYSPPPTCPDSLFYVRWGGTYSGYANAFQVPYLQDGIADSLPGYYDDCVCYMWLNRTLAPQDSVVLAQYLFSPLVLVGTQESNSAPAPWSGLALSCPCPLRPGLKIVLSSDIFRRDALVTVYSADGRRAADIYQGDLKPGLVILSLDNMGAKFASGVYFVVAKAGGCIVSQKLIYLR
ncbi:MAG TPA: hypothetical protein VF399_09280 [bacterium]